MNFELNDDQAAFQDAVERFVRERYTWDARKLNASLPLGARSNSWRDFAEMGLFGLLIPTEYGGTGGTMIDIGVAMEQLGKALVLDCIGMTAVNAVTCLLQAANDEQKTKYLPRIAAGELALAVASPSLQGGNSLVAPSGVSVRRQGRDWVLHGRQDMVAGADVADLLIIDAAVEGEGATQRALFIVERSALTVESYACHDGTRGADIILNNVVVSPDHQLSATNSPESVMALVRGNAIAAICNEAVGAMAAGFDVTLEYLRTRKQFGVPLSSFQALQHRSVEILMALERARSMAAMASMAACEALSPGRQARLAAAKIQINQSARFAGQQMVQLHGGMGMTDEYAAGHYFRRLTAIESALGDVERHLSDLVQQGGILSHA